ncbi:MAG: hypothetical protein HY040_12750 [Planctomycetes bacterium]|nr:hypothetical protein [Planctomycetota bacterium]
MARLFSVGLLGILLLPGVSSALEIKNVRPCYGVPLGATRHDVKLIPGDVLFITYDIEGLKVDTQTGKANYLTTLELLDSKETVLFKKETPNESSPQLGGTRMPGDLFINTGRTQKPGKYKIRLTVNDRIGKESKAFVYDFELLSPTFGFVGVTAPAVGFPGQNYMAGFALVDMSLDKNKQPLVDVMMRVLDQSGTKEVTKPIYSSLPKDLPEDTNLEKENFLPMQFPIYLNRAGTFMIEINAADKIANKKIQLKYPVTVIDVPGGK